MNTRVREYVPKNYISSGLYKSFASYCFLLKIMGSCRVDTSNRYVTHPSAYQKAYSILTIISTGCMYAIGQINYITRYRDEYTLYLLGSTLLLVHYTCYAIDILHLRFYNNDKNVNLVIKMQEIDRLMKLDRNKRFNDILRKLNNAAVLFLVFVFSLFVGSSAYGANSGTAVVLTTAGGIGESILVADLVLCSNIIEYFIMRIRFVNAIIANHLKENCALETQYEHCFKSNSFMRKLAAKTHDFRSCDTDVYIKEIMKGFYQFNNLYQSQMLLFCCKFVICLIIYFEIILLAGRVNKLEYVDIVIMTGFLISNVLIAVLMCTRCEIFTKEIKDTKNLCIAVTSIYVDDGPLRAKSKEMLHILEAKPPKFVVYDIWQIEAAFIIHILSIVTAVVVTLLQLAFL